METNHNKVKFKNKCPYCGQFSVETIYVISEGYRDYCENCKKSKLNRKAIKSVILIMLTAILIIAFKFLKIQEW